MPSPSSRDANWIDGLRGVASLIIVCGHVCTAFAPHLHAPALSEKGDFTLLQLPFLRLCVGGRSAVALFFLITGYVSAIGPIAKSRAGNVEDAFAGIARSALARSIRLVLPAMIATFISWLLAESGAYKMSEHVDATWIRQGYHGPAPSFAASVQSLVGAQVSTWTIGWNEYDGTQWTLILFLEGSFLVYTTMLSTIMVTPKARKLIFGLLYLYAWLSEPSHAHTSVKSMNVVVGMFVAEMHNEYGQAATSLLPFPIPSLVILLGLFCCGFPQQSAEWTWWSNAMEYAMKAMAPAEADIRRYWDSIGASLILIGIFFSPTARKILSTPAFNFLGRVSFPVYLLHNQLMKSLLTWMVYFPSALNPEVDAEGHKQDLRRGSLPHIAISLVIFYYVLYRLASLWVKYIDPMCGEIVKRVTSWATEDGPAEKPAATV
ncbi:hypothetical protein GQ53DRAFT_753709 [Thozetella sp. PMI_491]|nr:hypothetical protein GQ53DRAFT_753709 [Thozetella sp. PMI_491]